MDGLRPYLLCSRSPEIYRVPKVFSEIRGMSPCVADAFFGKDFRHTHGMERGRPEKATL